MATITTTTNRRGEFTFSGLAEGSYLITPTAPDSFTVFKPANYELALEHNVSNLLFYAGNKTVTNISDPPGPDKDSDTDGTYNISGKVCLPGLLIYGLPGITVTCEYLGSITGTEPTLPDPEVPRPDPIGRIVPAGLLTHKQGTQQSTCYCWAVTPKVGDPEGFTSYDENLDLPSYDSLPGQDDEVTTLPAMTYISSSGVSPTAIPTRLDLGKDGVEVTLLAFDRDKLLSQYYRGAEFEIFEINYRGDVSQRLVWMSGLLGEAKVGDLSASIALNTWADVANRQVGRNFSALCDVDRLIEFPDEEFGAGRCRNQILNDGPLKADWTVAATITSVTNRLNFSVSHGSTSINSTSLNAAFDDHLSEGKVLFTDGDNNGHVRQIKRGYEDGSDIALEMHVPFPFVIAVGDTLNLTAGCRKTPTDCKFYNNFQNFRGVVVPGRDAVLRRFS
jgi:uncharacterized phage protein (TIGR02218 family)